MKSAHCRCIRLLRCWDWLVLRLNELSYLRFHLFANFPYRLAHIITQSSQSSLSMKKLSTAEWFLIFILLLWKDIAITSNRFLLCLQNVLAFQSSFPFLSPVHRLAHFRKLFLSSFRRFLAFDSYQPKMLNWSSDDDKARVKSIISRSMRRTIGSFDGRIELTNQRLMRWR